MIRTVSINALSANEVYLPFRDTNGYPCPIIGVRHKYLLIRIGRIHAVAIVQTIFGHNELACLTRTFPAHHAGFRILDSRVVRQIANVVLRQFEGCAYEEYHSRIAIAGGMDVDFICRESEEAIRQRVRAMIERTGTRGGYLIGTGNSVPSYMPQNKYLAMVKEAIGYDPLTQAE